MPRRRTSPPSASGKRSPAKKTPKGNGATKREAPAPRGRALARRIIVGALFCGAAVAGVMVGLLAAYQSDIGVIERIEQALAREGATSIVYDRNGVELGQFRSEDQRRIVLGYEDLPQHLRDALVASEDKRFWGHHGFDPLGIARAAWSNLRAGRTVQGASTITQQVARELFDERAPTLERKIREAITAAEIERAYTKPEILTHYANLVHLGNSNDGVGAAARDYFDKSAAELTVGESAMLVGIAPNPARYNPFRSVEQAVRQRDRVLRRMVEDDFLTAEAAAAAQAEPLRLRARGGERLGAHFLEMVRLRLRRDYGGARTREGGLRVYTTLDASMQQAAEDAVERALRAHDKRRGFRGFERNLLDDGRTLEDFRDDARTASAGPGAVVRGVVTESGTNPRVRVGGRPACLDPGSLAWTFERPERLFRVGDVGFFRLLPPETEAEAAEGPPLPPECRTLLRVALDQEPQTEGAFLALEIGTGAVRALVGGFDFDRSEFNRATQARRQAGSSFKPFAYGAALASGRFSPASLILDQPFSYTDPVTRAVYEPQNYDQEHRGWITMRQAFEGSRNVPAVRMVHEVGPERVVDFARRLGISSDLLPVLSITLGSADVSLQEMVSAYSAFPNQGVRMAPYFITRITDRDGRELETFHPETASVIRADLAYVVTHLLQGVVARGTAVGARRLSRPVAGKTGTTNDFTDAWFIGFDTEIAAGVWVGHDQPSLTLGEKESGARVALPAWTWFMETVRGGAPPEEFGAPRNVALVPVDLESGQPAPPGPNTIVEAFLSGTEPTSGPGGDR